MMKKLRARADQESGFTLIELLIVITILGILAGIVVFAVGSTGANAKTNACKADVKTVETALESYKAQNPGAAYPAIAALKPNYLKDIPTEQMTVAADGTVTSTDCP